MDECRSCGAQDVPLYDVGWQRRPVCAACAEHGPRHGAAELDEDTVAENVSPSTTPMPARADRPMPEPARQAVLMNNTGDLRAMRRRLGMPERMSPLGMP